MGNVGAGETILILTVYEGEREISQEAFLKRTVLLGRDPYSDVHLDDPRVSRVHGSIRRKDRSFVFTDHSANGTVVNGSSAENRELTDGDSIAAGPFRVVVRIQCDAGIEFRTSSAVDNFSAGDDQTIRGSFGSAA